MLTTDLIAEQRDRLIAEREGLIAQVNMLTGAIENCQHLLSVAADDATDDQVREELTED